MSLTAVDDVTEYNAFADVEVLTSDMFFKETPNTEISDPFGFPIDEIKKFTGMSPALKRKASYLEKSNIGNDGAKSKQIITPFITGYDLFKVATPPYDQNYLAQLYEINPYHYAAVNAKVANVCGLGYNWVESPKLKLQLQKIVDPAKMQRTRAKIEQAKLDMDTWLDSLNQEDLFVETISKVYTDYLTTGNGYLEIGRTTTGVIGYVGHIPATSIRCRIEKDGYVQIVGQHVVFFNNYGTTDQIPDPFKNDPHPNEIIHFKNYTPTNSYYGIPDVLPAKNNVAGIEFAARFNLEYFENKAVPRHVVVMKGGKLGTVQERRLMEFFEVGLKGKSHRTLFIPLPADTAATKYAFDIKPVESKIQDGSFTNYDAANRDAILFASRVPISKIGIPADLNLAAAAGADKTFKEQVCGPEQDILEKKVGFFVKEKSDALVLSFTELTLTTADTQSQIDERDIQNQIKVPNEIRADRGMPGLPGGDKVVEKPVAAAAAKKPAKKAVGANRTARSKARSNNQSDNPAAGSTGRNPKGEGRKAP